MKNELEAVFTKLTTVTPEPEDYTGEDGLLYCGKCRTPKEAYHTEETRALTGHDKRPSECDCQRAKRLEREAAQKAPSNRGRVEAEGLYRPENAGMDV